MGPSSAFCWRFDASNFESVIGFGGIAPNPLKFFSTHVVLCLGRFMFHTCVPPLTWSLFSTEIWEIHGLFRAMHAVQGITRPTGPL